MKDYCVTGVSKLSGQREILTPPCSKYNAELICRREKAKHLSQRDYYKLQVEEYHEKVKEPVQLELAFK